MKEFAFRRLIFISPISILLIFSNSCNTYHFHINDKLQNRNLIAHRILFSGIDTERTKYDREQYNAGKKIYFDPVMTFRPTISFKGKKFENRFGKNASNALLIEKYLSEKYPLVIPDSLHYMYSYYSGIDNIAQDSSVYRFVSPLLPTSEKDIYIMQFYIVASYKDGSYEFRDADRYFKKYRIQGDKVEILETISGPYDFFSVDR